jgi:hypothetical protein
MQIVLVAKPVNKIACIPRIMRPDISESGAVDNSPELSTDVVLGTT